MSLLSHMKAPLGGRALVYLFILFVLNTWKRIWPMEGNTVLFLWNE